MIKLKLHRGDYLKKTINLTDSTGSAINADELYFTVKKSTTTEDYVLQKKLSDGDIVQNEDGSYTLEILPEDTDNLTYGTYVFDLQLYVEDPLVKKTFLGQLTILEEVTFASNETANETA